MRKKNVRRQRRRLAASLEKLEDRYLLFAWAAELNEPSAASTAVIERLGFYGFQIGQVALLDGHDFDQSLFFDDCRDLASLGLLPGYGVKIWDNVSFAHVYYQTGSL